MTDWIECRVCGDDFSYERWSLGYKMCLKCGEASARDERKSWTIAPMHKSNYMLFTNMDDLVGINNKGGLVK
jgi:ribosomal protein L37AE/L43A